MWYAGAAAAIAVVLSVAAAAFLSLQTTFEPVTATKSDPCSPTPCASVQGYKVWVSNFKIESGLVTMQLTFQNSSSSTHADPSDMQLLDAQETASSAVYDAPGCTHWPRTEFNNGAKFGPVPDCFRPRDLSGPVTMHWSPDMGLFCCDVEFNLN